jgi:hypothetical protein
MKLLLKTKILGCIVIALLLLNYLNVGQGHSAKSLPVLEELFKGDISRIEISQASEKIILSKEEGTWVVVSPNKGKADLARIRSLILNFRKPIPMDALIDTNNEEKYGLEGGNALVVELWTEGAEAKVSFLLGADATKSSSFIRISGSDAIYRARIGGRRRYAYSARDWLSQQVIPLELNDITSISTQETSGNGYQIKKGTSLWEIEGIVTDDLDQKRIGTALRSLIRLRIGERVSVVDFVPAFQMELGTTSGAPFQFQIAEVAAGGALLKVVGEEEVYRVASPALERFFQGGQLFLNRKLLSMDDRNSLDLVQFSSKTQKIIIQQDLSNNFWKVLEPTNFDLDLREIFFMVNTLLSMEYLAEFTGEVDIGEPIFSIMLRSLSGDVEQVSIHNVAENTFAATIYNKKGVFEVSFRELETIVKGFGQTNSLK